MVQDATKKHLSKIAIYCPNQIGLGHIMRSLQIARALNALECFSITILTNCRAIDSISIPNDIAVYKLTPVSLDPYDESRYHILGERIKQLNIFFETVRPEILLVDTFPFGEQDIELKQILKSFKTNKQNAPICVLGSPYPPREGFERYLANSRDVDILSVYHSGMIYSDEDWGTVYDNVPFPMTKMGLVTSDLPPITNPFSKTILVITGGGTLLVSESLIDPVIKATALYRKQGYKVRFIVGLLGDFEKAQSHLNNADNFELIRDCSVEEAIKDAKVVIARCGYNTATTLIRTTLPIIFIPFGREHVGEQFTRARKLSKMKNISMIDSAVDEINSKLYELLQIAMESSHETRDMDISFNGAEKAAHYLTKLLEK